MIQPMRRSLLFALILAGCAQQPALAPPRNARTLQTLGARTLLAEPLAQAPRESEGAPEYRIWSVEQGRARVVLSRASWAAWAGDALLAVEDGELKLHRGGATRTLLQRAAPDFAVDPSGKWVAAVVRRSELALDTDLVLMPALGGPQRAIAAFPGSSESRPIFTPDDRAVIFVSGKSSLASLYRVELASGALTQLTNVGATRVGPEFVPPPPDAASMHFEGEVLVYAASGKTWRIDARGGR